MQASPKGQVVINMKTTILAHGSHNGVIVHSAIQSAPSTSTNSAWSWIPPVRLAPIEPAPRLQIGHGDTSQSASQRDLTRSSPMPIQMLASTSQETLNTSGLFSPVMQSSTYLPPTPAAQPTPILTHQRSESPVYSFKGDDSPPDEFIEPMKLVLNVFNPQRRESYGDGYQLRHDAVIDDRLTSTTTVEVFRTKLGDDTPVVALPPAPTPSTDPRHYLIRTHGPQYETWSNTITENLPREPLQYGGLKAVQWKEKLVEGTQSSSSIQGVDLDDRNEKFGFDLSRCYQLGPELEFREVPLGSPSQNRDPVSYLAPERPYKLLSPKNQSNAEVDSKRQPYPSADSPASFISALRPYSSTSNLAYRTPSQGTFVGADSQESILQRTQSPLYVIPDRKQREPRHHEEGERHRREKHDRRHATHERQEDRRIEASSEGPYEELRTDSQNDYEIVSPSRSRHGRQYSRRSKSSVRDNRHTGERRRRSSSPSSNEAYIPTSIGRMSPAELDRSISPINPNLLPGRPASATSQEIFALYQTRDAMNRVVDL